MIKLTSIKPNTDKKVWVYLTLEQLIAQLRDKGYKVEDREVVWAIHKHTQDKQTFTDDDFIPPKKCKDKACEVNLIGEFSGDVWAKEFMRNYELNLSQGVPDWIQLDLTRAWFCNAIMAGYDHANQKKRGGKKEENILDKIEFAYGNETIGKGVKVLYHKQLKTIISIREKYTGLKSDSFIDKPTPQKSICDICQEVCKATHPRSACSLFKPISGEKKAIVKYKVSGDGKGLLGFFEDETFYHIHSDEMTKLERWIFNKITPHADD